jgi:hypothetical protein
MHHFFSRGGNLQISCLSKAAVVLVCFPCIAGAQKERLLQFSISESEHPELASVMKRIPVQRLLLDMAAAPRTPDEVKAALSGIGVSPEQLEHLRLIRRRDDRYVVAFYLLTRADLLRVREVTDRYAQSLTEALLARRAEIEAALSYYDAPGVDPKTVAYFVLGCVSLDWDGLDLTIEKGYRKKDPYPAMTWIGSWWTEEANELTWEKYYWGSHNSTYGDVRLTSFGDHSHEPRVALPDLVWTLSQERKQSDWPDTTRPFLRSLSSYSPHYEHTAEQVGRMLFALRDGEKNLTELASAAGTQKEEAQKLLTILLELQYVASRDDRYQARVPVLTQRDSQAISTVRAMGREIMEGWLANNYDKLKSDLSHVTPWRDGQSFAEGFYPVWHCIFGTANRLLVQAGLFADPCAESRKFKGYIPVAFQPSVVKRP